MDEWMVDMMKGNGGAKSSDRACVYFLFFLFPLSLSNVILVGVSTRKGRKEGGWLVMIACEPADR